MSKKYTGLQGANNHQKFNYVREALEKYVLEEDIKLDVIAKLDELLEDFNTREKKSTHWDNIKAHLTAKQLLKVLEE